MNTAHTLTIPVAIALVGLAAATVHATEGVSPGAVDRMVQVNSVCPTFSWGLDGDAVAYELVAYFLPDDAVKGVELTADSEVLFTRIAGSATSWTPSAEQHFAPGECYVWFVRAVTEMVDDQVIEAGEWSAGRYFSVPAGPTDDEVARAIEVLNRWQGANGGGSLFAGSAAASAAAVVPDADSDADADAGWAAPKSVPTASAAVRGEHPGTSGEVYGLVGTSASYDGAGVAAANLDGGPDLVLDGSADGAPDIRLSESGLTNDATGNFVYEVKNQGEGSLSLEVQGHVDADLLKISGVEVIDDGGAWVGSGSMLPCVSCVESGDIADGTIIDNDLAADAVTGDKIEHGAVSGIHLESNSVNSAKIADGTVSMADLAAGSVGTAQIVDRGVMSADIDSRAVGTIQLDDSAVTGEKLAANSVTSSKITNGSITAADVDPTGGIYASKLAVYSSTVTGVIGPAQCVSLTASCTDSNDLALHGVVGLVPNHPIYTRFTWVEDWDSEDAPALFGANVCYDPVVGSDETISTTIYCVTVPGS